MKLAIYFGLDTLPYIVGWDKDIMDFHQYVSIDGEDWQWTVHDKDPTYLGCKPLQGVSHYLLFCKTKAVPYDIFGQKMPIVDFRAMFGIASQWKKCECGAEKVHGKNTGHATWCPLWSKA